MPSDLTNPDNLHPNNIWGIVLAGGTGSRLGELTKVTNKHLLPVGDYPMIYHPIKKLVGANINNIVLVSGTEHMGDFVELLGSGTSLGADLTYRVQDKPGGIAQALEVACHVIPPTAKIVVLLGDNIFYDPLRLLLKVNTLSKLNKAQIVLSEVTDPQRYGVPVFEYDDDFNRLLINIEEKPLIPRSRYAVTGIYVYPNKHSVMSIISNLKPSSRNELEITDLNNCFIRSGQMEYCHMTGFWTDAGTIESLHLANTLIRKRGIEYV